MPRATCHLPLAASAFVLGAQFFFGHLTRADHVFAFGRNFDAAERGGVSFILIRLVLVKTNFFRLQETARHLHAARKATEQRFKTFTFFAFDFYHR